MSKGKRLKDIRRKAKIIGIVFGAVNIMIVGFGLYMVFSTGNILYFMPFFLVSAVLNVVVISKLQDMLAETQFLIGDRHEVGVSMVDDLKKEFRTALVMVTDKGFWKLIWEDIVETLREVTGGLRKGK